VADTYIDSQGTTVLPAGGTFTGDTANPWTPGGLIIGHSAQADLTIADGAVVNDSGGTMTTSIIGDQQAGSVYVTGPGSTWTLANGLYVGTFGNGTLEIHNGGTVSAIQNIGVGNDPSGIDSGTVTVDSGGTLSTENVLYVGRINATGTVNIGNNGVLRAREIYISDPSVGNTATGTLSLNGGLIQTSSITRGAGSALVAIGGGGVLRAAESTGGFLSGFNAGEVALSTGGGVFDSNGFDIAIASPLGGPGGLTKDGAGTLTLSSVNTYEGGTTISNGTLALSGAGKLSDVGSVALDGGAFDISNITASSTTIGALSGAAGTTVALGSKTLAVDSASNTTYAGQIGGTGSLVKAGTGTLILAGSNSYSGGTTISGGTLQISETGGISGNIDTGTVANHGTLAIVTNSTSSGPTISGNISGSGGLNVTGYVALTGTNDFSGGTVINHVGLLVLGNRGTTGSITGDISNSGLLGFERADSYTYGGNISGTGTLWQQGAGTITLTGTNSFSTLYLTVGSVQVGDGGTTGSISGDVLTSNGPIKNTLAFDRSDAVTFNGVISATGGIAQIGAGTLTLTGANTYSGTTAVNAGTLRAGAVNVWGNNSAVTVAAGATLDLNDYAQAIGSLAGAGDVLLGTATLSTGADGTSTAYSGNISGGGSLDKDGAGTLTLTGTNTYTGLTMINAGTLRLGDGATNGSVAGNILDNASLVFDNGSAQSYSGVISGTGNLTKQGAGTLTLTGANSYTGGTLVLAGNLEVTTTSLPGDATVDSGAYITFDQDTAGNYNGVISGAGSVQKTGTGAVVFTAVQNYTGGTSIDTGALQATTDTLGGSVNVATDAALVLNQAFDGSYAGQVTGGGSLVKAGTGTVTLAGANTYSGPTAVLDGTLTQGAANAFVQRGAYIVNGGTLDLHGYDLMASSLVGTGGTVALGGATLTLDQASDSTYAGAITGQGGFIKDGAGTLTLSGTSTYSGPTTLRAGVLKAGAANALSANSTVTVESAATLDLGGTDQGIASLSGSGNVLLGAGTLTTGGDGTDTTYAGALSGSGGLVKQGNGLFTLNGNSAAFTGLTTVAGGSLEVGDIDKPSAVLGGNVTVGDSGTLRGHGTILGNVSSTGTVAPGGSIGTLTVNGNYTQASNGTLQIEVSPTQASQLNVGGTANLAGTLALVYDPGTYSARSYTIVSANGGVTGAFGTVSSTGTEALGTLKQAVNVGTNTVDLVLAAPDSSTDTPPPPTGPTVPVVIAPTQTSIYTALGTTALLGSQSANNALLDRAGSRLLASTGTGSSQTASAASTASPDSALWATLTGNYTRVDGSHGAPGFQSQRYGFLAGHDRPAGTGILGVAFGYDHADIQERGTDSTGKLDTLRLGVYGGRAAGPVVLNATAGVGVNFLSQKRRFDALGTARGDHTGQEASLGLQAGLPLALGARTLLTPKLGLRYTYEHADSFNESGAGGQDLDVGKDNIHSLQPYVGVALDQTFGDEARPMNAQVRVGYAREVLDANREVGVTAQDGTPFSAVGAKLPRGSLTAGLSFTLHPRKNLDVSLNYDTLINTDGASAQQGGLHMAYRF